MQALRPYVRLTGLAVTVGLAVWLLPISLRRLIDGDEGYFLFAARLISEGNLPYRDFFLPQGPVVPGVFAALFLATGRSWIVARIAAGVIAVLLGVLVYQESLSATRRRLAAGFAALLFAFSASTVGWLTIVKGFALAALWTLLAMRLARMAARSCRSERDRRRRLLASAGAGVALGLAASTRLYLILAAPMLAIYLLRQIGLGRRSLRHLAYYALGLGCGLAPLVVTFAVDRKSFVFDTLLFHGVREWGQSSLFGRMSDKLPVILKAVGWHRRATFEARQILGLGMLALAGMLARIPTRNRYRSSAGWVWPALLAGSVLPNPFLAQYLCLLVPFLAIEAGVLLAICLDFVAGCNARAGTATARIGMAVVGLGASAYLAYHVAVGWTERDRYLEEGTDVPGIWSHDRAPRWRIATVEAIAKEIDLQGHLVAASWWPGYFATTETRLVPSLANDFGFRAAEALSPDERRRFHVLSHADLGDMIRKRTPRLFVEGNWAARPWANWLPESGYRLCKKVHNASFWTIP